MFQSASSEIPYQRNKVLSSSYQGQYRPQNEVAEVPRSLPKSELDHSQFDRSRLGSVDLNVFLKSKS